jgi:hypothetical protein
MAPEALWRVVLHRARELGAALWGRVSMRRFVPASTVAIAGRLCGPPVDQEVVALDAIERRDLRVGNVWEKDAQHHPHHMRRRLADGGWYPVSGKRTVIPIC